MLKGKRAEQMSTRIVSLKEKRAEQMFTRIMP